MAESFVAPLAEPQAASMQSNGAAASAFDNPIDFPSGASAGTAVALWRVTKPLANFIFRTSDSDLTAIFLPPGTWARATNPLPHHREGKSQRNLKTPLRLHSQFSHQSRKNRGYSNELTIPSRDSTPDGNGN